MNESDEELVDRFGNACLKSGKSNSGLCISATASSDWEAMRQLRQTLKERFARVRAMALTCCSCSKVLDDLQELKRHIVECHDHPIAQYVKEEREACAKVAESLGDVYNLGNTIAGNIRARSKPPLLDKLLDRMASDEIVG